jgi:hypothetical protein
MPDHRSPHARARIPDIDRMESLEEIAAWLGTFTERLRLAREHEREDIAGTLGELYRQYRLRRAELA